MATLRATVAWISVPRVGSCETGAMATPKHIVATTLRRAGLVVRRTRTADPWYAVTQHVTAQSPVVFDVGANIGETTLRCARALPHADIHAFEPSPATFEQLSAACASLRKVRLVNAAMGPAVGTMALHENDSSNMTSFLLPTEHAWGSVVKQTDVPVETVDSYCDKHEIERLAVLKTDTQGYDLAVLHGASGMLSAGRIDMLLIELVFAPLYEDMPRFDELISFALDQGFRLVGFYDTGYRHGLAAWADALFVRAP